MPYESRIPKIAAELDLNVTHAVGEGARRIAESAKERVPIRTGKLKAAIHVRQQGQSAWVICGNKDAFYGHIVEYGSVNAAPRPFAVPALEEHRADVEALIRARLRGL